MKVTAKIERTYKSIEVKSHCNDVQFVTLSRKQIEVHSTKQPINMTVVQDQNVGWGTFTNTVHTKENPFTYQAGVPFVLPIRNDAGLTDQAPEAVKNLIDNDTNKLLVDNLNDAFIARLEFVAVSDLSEQRGRLYFDIGNDKPFNFERFDTALDLDDPDPTTVNLLFFQKETFLANGANIIMTIDDDGELWDIKLTPIKLYNGKASV